MYFSALSFVLGLFCFSMFASIAGLEFSSLLMAILFLFHIKKYPKLAEKLFFFSFIAYFLAQVLSATLSPFMSSKERWEQVAEQRWLLVAFAISYILIFAFDKLFSKKFILALAGFVALICVYSLVQFFTGIDAFRKVEYYPQIIAGTKIWRAKGFFSSTMTFSTIFGMWFCFLVPFAFFPLKNIAKGELQKLSKKYYYAFMFLLGVCLICTFTRGMWLSVILSLGLLSIFFLSKVYALYYAGFITSLLAIGLSTSSVFRERFTSIVSLSNHSNYQRLDIWKANWAMFLDHPWFGVGLHFTDDLLTEYYQKLNMAASFVGHSHNSYFQLLTGGGILVFISYLVFNIALIYQLAKIANSNLELKGPAIGVIGALLCFHFNGFVESSIIDTEVRHAYTFFIAVGLFLFFKNKNKRLSA